jgi:hypothetical protein
VDEAFKTGEAQDRAAGESVFDADTSAHHHENHQPRQHPENGDAADDRQGAALEVAPVAAGRLNQAARHLVGNADPAGDLVALLQRVQELVFLHRFGGGLEGKLRRGRTGDHEQQRQCGAERFES